MVDPTSPGRYLLGVECDGATYHRAATARDRDKLRQMILEDLGWRVHRIWSTDWWHAPEDQMTKLLSVVAMLQTAREEAQRVIWAVESESLAISERGRIFQWKSLEFSAS